MKIPIFPSKYHQNGGFSMAMLVYRSVTPINTPSFIFCGVFHPMIPIITSNGLSTSQHRETRWCRLDSRIWVTTRVGNQGCKMGPGGQSLFKWSYGEMAENTLVKHWGLFHNATYNCYLEDHPRTWIRG